MTGNNDTIAAELREHGLRATAARCVALEWLREHPHATAEQVHEGVAGRLGSVSKQAVYDVLAACVAIGLVRRIKPAGHSARFERHQHNNHHHLVCRGCGRVEDTACHTRVAPCLEPVDNHGFRVDRAEVIFWGLCPNCAHEQATTGGLKSSISA